MATHKRKATKGKPITSHPLFPAVVALWFGALFGLGSLAVRASLLESLVLKSRIDLVVPAAAPPLGLTARMLVALALAAIGALVGAVIARRAARPKPETYQRKREARLAREEDYSVRSLDPSAQPLDPVAVSFGEASDEDADAVSLSSRRRPLAIQHEEVAYVPHEFAPLPGGQPQILDIAGMNLGEPMGVGATQYGEPAQYEPQGSASEPVQSFKAVEEQPLDLGSFAESAPQPASPSLDWSQAKPVAFEAGEQFARPAPSMIEQQRQMFQPEQFQADQAAPVADDPQRQVFGQAPAEPFAPELPAAEPAAPAHRQMFGQTAQDDHVPGEYVQSLGYRTTVFDTPEVQPLFPVREEAAAPMPEPAPFAAPEPAAFAPPVAEPEEVSFAPVEAPAVPTPVAAPAIVETAAIEPLEPLPDPASLGMTELALRLAESMRRRRAARAAAAAAASTAAIAAVTAKQEPVAAFDEPVHTPEIADEPVGEEQAIEAASETFFEGEVEAVVETGAEAASETDIVVPPPYVPPFAHIEPIDEPLPAPFARLSGAGAEPAAPTAFEVAIERIESAPAVSADVPPAPIAMPAALRPINFDDFADDGADALLDSLLPPRSLGESAATAPEEAAPQVATAPEEPVEVEVEIEAEIEPELAAAEENYGSLLDLGPVAPRNPFVRINEPETAGDAIEPVVIFPGQAARQQFEAPAAPRQVPLGDDDASHFRRFDAPNQAEQGQMVAAPGQNPQADPEEAERALRAALANLQRISGAA